ncbi:hypothetical protein ABIE91_001086 [Bradyrhizobium elkanii]
MSQVREASTATLASAIAPVVDGKASAMYSASPGLSAVRCRAADQARALATWSGPAPKKSSSRLTTTSQFSNCGRSCSG